MQTRIEKANPYPTALKRENMMSYEVINLKTGKSVGRYESERTAQLRYGGSKYVIKKSDQPANAWPVGFNAL